jgi:DNA polymerase-3 subunit delta'
LLLCERPSPEGARCSQCTPCKLAAAGSHPDMHVISPPEDKQTILIDQIRALASVLGMKSHGGGRKIALIYPADRMNPPAANSLLKTLEEPTDNTVLILVSERPARLPATIRSRCQVCRIAPPSEKQARAWLSTHTKDGEDIETLLRLSAGAPLKALALAQDEILAIRRSWFGELQGLREEREDPVEIAATWSSAKLELAPLQWFGFWLTDMIRSRQVPEARLNDPDFEDALRALGKSMGLDALHDLLQKVWRALRLSETSVNRQLLVEDILIEWAQAKQEGTVT